MKNYIVTLTGRTPLLMHWDNIEWQDSLLLWRTRPENKKNSTAGDDRTPPFTWKGYCYHDGTHLCIPSDNIRPMMMEAGKKIPKAKGRGSFKAEAVSSILIDALYLDFRCNGKQIKWADIEAIEGTFSEHVEAVRKLGFELYTKRAAVGTSKHIRVRPRFASWSLAIPMIAESDITDQVMADIFEIAGRFIGLCDWRPGSKKSPGPFGQFDAKIESA